MRDECMERGCRGARGRQCCVDGNGPLGRSFHWVPVGITKERLQGGGCYHLCVSTTAPGGKTIFYFCQSAKEMRVRACGVPWL